MQRILDYCSLSTSETATDVYREADFAIRRTNLQSSPDDRHVYQSFRSMPLFWQVLNFTTTSSLSIIYTRIMKRKPHWSLGQHFQVSMFVGLSCSIIHGYFMPPYQIGRIANWDDNYYSVVMRQVLNARNDKDKWYSALGLEPTHTLTHPRKLWTVPNFQLTGYPAVITTTEDQDPPIDATPLDESEFLNDLLIAAKQYHAIENDKKNGKMPAAAQSSADVALSQINNNINLYLQINGMERPAYLEQYDAYQEQIFVERPADYLHVWDKGSIAPKSTKDGVGTFPTALKSPHDIKSVIETRQKLQQESNKKIHEQYMKTRESNNAV